MEREFKIKAVIFIVFCAFLVIRDIRQNAKHNAQIERLNISLTQAVGLKLDSSNNVIRVENSHVFANMIKQNEMIKNDLKDLGIKYKSLQSISIINNTYINRDTFIVSDTLILGKKTYFADTTSCIKVYGSFLVDSLRKVNIDIYRKEYVNSIRVYPYIEKINWWKFGQKKRNGLKVLSFRNNYIPRVQTKSDCGDIRIDIIENIEAINESLGNDK